MSTGLKANSDGSAAIQVGGTDVITLTSGGAATFVTSPTTVQAGTAAAPSITTSGDTNTGIFFPAADTVAIGTGGTERTRVSSDGTFRVKGAGTAGSTDAVQFNGSAPASSMTLDASGRLGIGATSTPASYQNVLGYFQNGRSGWAYVVDDSANTHIVHNIIFNGTNNTYAGNGYASRMSIIDADGSFRWYQAASGSSGGVASLTERARITSGGLVGIGIQSPGGTLDVNTSDNTINSILSRHSGASAGNLQANSSNASLAGNVIESGAVRSANAAYKLFAGYSGNFGDLEFGLYGDGNGKCDGSWTGGGADYAEFFESATGAALTLGATVVLDGNKVREATDQDPVAAIMGVVRPKEPGKATAVIANAAWNKWANKYLTDDFDRYIMEDHDVFEWTDEEGNLKTYESHNIPAGVTVPDDAVVKTHDDNGNKFQHYKLNPAWNPDAEYVNRENRPEWIIVGLVGQVKILKGQPVNDRWIKMRDVSATVEEWMIR